MTRMHHQKYMCEDRAPARITHQAMQYAPLKPLKCCPHAYLMVGGFGNAEITRFIGRPAKDSVGVSNASLHKMSP